MSTKPRQVWFLVMPRVSMINLAGPWEVFGHANDLLGREVYQLSAYSSSAPSLGTRYGIMLAGLRPLPSVLKPPPEVLVVAGASPLEVPPGDQAELVPWLRRHGPAIPTLVSICTGAFALASAGLLDGRKATTHWQYTMELKKRFPKVKVVDEGIFVKHRGVWTSAGLTAGIDLALAMVEEHHGHDLAMRVAKRMVLFLRRSGHQAQFSVALRSQEREPSQLRDIAGYVLAHIREPLPVERIAEAMGMSPRTLSRWCRRHLEESPAELVRRLRMAEARILLEETSLPLKELVARTGFGDLSTLWRGFVGELGVTPSEYRQRFASKQTMLRTG
jgi:transcriptional regulator GlxA family with amidase domain